MFYACAGRAPPEQFVDLGFMRQLERTGRGADANLMGSRYVK